MPLYEYRCDACQKDFEAFREAKARRKAPCPTCGRPGRKLVRAVEIIFKGSGFHVTDYRKPEPKREPTPPAAAPSKEPTPSASRT